MDSSASDAIDAGLGIARVCAYATQCKCLSPSSQGYPVEDSDVLASAPVSQYVTATCPAPPTLDADRRWCHELASCQYSPRKQLDIAERAFFS